MSEGLTPSGGMQAKKAYSASSIGHPFPNYFVSKWELPVTCRCIYDGNDFFVSSENDIQNLYHNGSFGVSNLTFRAPQNHDEKYKCKPYYKKMIERIGLKRRLLEEITSDKEDSVDDCLTIQTVKNVTIEEEIEETEVSTPIIQNASSYSESGKPQNMYVFKEKLMLMAEEVIFLSFAVGCLTIQNVTGKLISYLEVWKNLVAKDPEFIISYAVYHYFRSKNWVPKIGISFGGSYILYKIGPDFYHAGYIVYIIGYPSRPRPNWREMYAFQRLARHVGKHVVLCDVTLPKDFSIINSEPRSIFQLKIQEACIYRWKPTTQDT